MPLIIPESLKIEHRKLHEELTKAANEPGKIGETARSVADALHAHFEKEEEYALPTIGMLRPLVEGRAVHNVQEAVCMSERLKADLPHMLAEHQAIVAELEKLSAAAREENKPEYARFAEKLMLHALTEEEVLYPAAILAGEYLKLKFVTEPVC